MKKKFLVINVILGFSALFLTNCKHENSINMENHIEVAKLVYSSRFQGDLGLFRKVSTDKAYEVFEEETNLLNRANNGTLMTSNINVRADTIIGNVAWVSLNDGMDLNTTVRLIKTDSGWKTDIYNPFKEKSPLRNEVVKFPNLKKR